MANKNFLRLDKLNADAYLESVVSESEELLAGQFVKLGTLVDGDRELTKITKAEAGSDADVIVAPVVIDYGYPGFDPADQSVKAGKAARAVHIEKGMIFSINKEAVVGAVVGDSVAVGANGLGFKKADTGEAVIGTVIGEEYYSNVGDLVVIRF